ncbi:MAG: bifunctional nuclease family protein [Lentisphaeria bacterium]|nr:bifunctional nuclease family protein [Lentisphaeria bacterium]NQZ67333.1 bifunctional nuclease family protein [Lentisphaeria bacterium]
MKESYIQVKLDSISIFNYNFILLLKHGRDELSLPICIGMAEAHSIASVFNDKPWVRPLTHDLMKATMDSLNCTIDRITIVDLKEGTFFARLHLIDKSGHSYDLDARPSDAIALAIRYNAEIFIREDIYHDNKVDIDEQEGCCEELDLSDELDPMTKLQKRLDQAINEERFEEAAKLRDELQKILPGN